jgi:hypothetical protein
MLPALGLSFSATGCLVAEAPEYGPPEQRPPVINTQLVDPSPYKVLIFQPDSVAEPINVPVRSEDAGERLVGTLWVDWQVDGRTPVYVWDEPVPASSFDDVSRHWDFSFLPGRDVTQKCGHTLTLLLMHESNYDASKKVPKENVDWDIASVTWQLNVWPTDPAVIEPCPPDNVTP